MLHLRDGAYLIVVKIGLPRILIPMTDISWNPSALPSLAPTITVTCAEPLLRPDGAYWRPRPAPTSP